MKLKLLWLALLLAVPISAARAAPGCTASLTSISFGSYDVFNSGNLTWSGTVSYVCSGGVTGPIFLDLTTGGSGSFSPRTQTSGTNPLNYNVYTDSTYSTIWGDGTAGTGEYFSAANPPNGVTILVPIYGQIPALQNASVGTYGDTLTLTIFWTKKAIGHNSTSSVPASATVVSKCSIATSPLLFGTYDPLVANAAAPQQAQGAVMTTCTKGAATTIGLDLGLNFTGSQRRLMATATELLNYELYQDSGRSIVWGNSGAALLTPAASPSNLTQTFPVYGSIPAGQDVAAGTFTDTVTATITY